MPTQRGAHTERSAHTEMGAHGQVHSRFHWEDTLGGYQVRLASGSHSQEGKTGNSELGSSPTSQPVSGSRPHPRLP